MDDVEMRTNARTVCDVLVFNKKKKKKKNKIENECVNIGTATSGTRVIWSRCNNIFYYRFTISRHARY